MVVRSGWRRSAVALLVAGLLMLPGCRSVPGNDAGKTFDLGGQSFNVTTVELPFAACGNPQKVGSSIYAIVSQGVDKGDSLICYDLKSKTVKTVTEAPGSERIGWLVANDHWLVWSVGLELFAQSLDTGDRQTVSSSRDLYAPSLNGNLIAWDDLTTARTHQIVIRDLESKETSVVAPLTLADFYNNFPSWDDSRLVWTDVVEGQGHYYAFDVATGMREDYALTDGRFRFPGYAQAAGDRIYSLNFDNTDEWNWNTQQLGYYSKSEKRFVSVVAEGSVVNFFRIAGNLLAVVDQTGKLTLRLADGDAMHAQVEPLSEAVDFVQASPDGTLIAWRDASGAVGKCKLFLIEKR